MRPVRRNLFINRTFVCRRKEKLFKAIDWKESLESRAKKLRKEYWKDVRPFELDETDSNLDEDDDSGSNDN